MAWSSDPALYFTIIFHKPAVSVRGGRPGPQAGGFRVKISDNPFVLVRRLAPEPFATILTSLIDEEGKKQSMRI
jgi:hypothetical protein